MLQFPSPEVNMTEKISSEQRDDFSISPLKILWHAGSDFQLMYACMCMQMQTWNSRYESISSRKRTSEDSENNSSSREQYSQRLCETDCKIHEISALPSFLSCKFLMRTASFPLKPCFTETLQSLFNLYSGSILFEVSRGFSLSQYFKILPYNSVTQAGFQAVPVQALRGEK